MKKFKEITTELSESKYGDAMSSRLLAHLDDPRHDEKIDRERKAVSKASGSKDPFWKDLEKRKATAAVKESVWESYRTKALTEARLHVPLKGHPYHYKSDAELHYIIKDAAEAEKAISSHDKKAMWKYGDQQNDAATILGHRQRGGKQLVHPKSIHEEAPHPGFVMDFASHTEHSYHGGHEAKAARDAYAKHLKSLGHVVKKSSTPNQILHGTWGHVYHVSYKPKHLDEAHEVALNESGPETYKVGDRVVPKIGPHKGEMHRVIHVHPTGHLNIMPENSGYGRKNRYHLGAAKAHPKDVVKMGQPINNIKWPQDKKVEESLAIHLKEVTEREAASHADRVGSTLDANHNSTQDKVKKAQAEYDRGTLDMMRNLVFKKKLPSGRVMKEVHMPSHVPSVAAKIIEKGLRKLSGHPIKVTMGKGKSIPMEESVGTVPNAAFNESGDGGYKVGDRVVPKIGPHKGQVHTVIHVHPTGHVNIKPELRPGSKNRYHLGAAKAHPNDLTRHLKENMTPEHVKYILDRAEHPNDYAPKKHGWLKNRGNQFHKWPAGVKLHNVNPLTSRKTVREAFEAAKAKKVKTNDFKEPKDLKSKNDQDPQQADMQAAPSQFGGKDNSAPKEEKKSNAPAPEKKGNKLIVQGAGPDDKFQADPIVTPLTTMPDTVSPKSGSQGVR